MKRNTLFILLTSLALMLSCGEDDGLLDPTVVDPVLLSEAEQENETELVDYLQTHFYNYEEFDNPPANFDYKIKFDTIAGDNADKTSIFSMSDMLEALTISVPSEIFGRDDEEVIDHTLYVLKVREGSGESPTVGDNAILQYEGSLTDGTFFDASNNPVVLYMSGVVRGFGEAVNLFNTGEGPIENGDGTVSYENYGIGAVFIPSGLGYFDAPPNGIIPTYANLIFKFDVLSYEVDTDFDGDGIPSILEDLNGDGYLNNDNTDEDTEFGVFFANHNDNDDDNDGILTLDEISDDEGNIIIPYPDCDNDGTPDYLDTDSCDN